MSEGGPSIFDIVAAGLAVLALGEVTAARFFAAQGPPRNKLIASLLLWEGLAMLACAGVLHLRQDFGLATIVAVIAIWLAAAGVGLLRAGFFDSPRD